MGIMCSSETSVNVKRPHIPKTITKKHIIFTFLNFYPLNVVYNKLNINFSEHFIVF
jgi:hypothetical protein